MPAAKAKADADVPEKGTEDAAPTAIERVEHPDLVTALAAAQGEFPIIEKTQTANVPGKNGKSGYSYSYADLGDVLTKVRPVLSRHGLALVQRTMPLADNNKTSLVTELRHGAEVLESIIHIHASTAEPQQFGGSLTYLRRYEVVTLLGIAAEEDRDAQDVDPVRPGNTAAPAAAPLPPWATAITTDANKRLLVGRVNVLLGDDAAREALTVINTNLGLVPAVVNMTVGLILDSILKGNPDELVSRLADEQAKRINATRKAEADADAARQAAERQEAEAAHAAAEAPDAEPTPAEVARNEVAAADAARTAELDATAAPEVAGDVPAEQPPLASPAAGSVQQPDLSGLGPVQAIEALRGRGCTCPEPLKAMTDDNARDTECPLQGHGIGF